MNTTDMKDYGFTPKLMLTAQEFPELYPGRVISQSKGLYEVICERGKLMSEVSGKLRFEAKSALDFPAVGDFVLLDRNTSENGNAIIHRVLERKSAFIRKAAGEANESQIVAANIDTVFICMSLNNDFNLRRLERYLAIAWDSGARPVAVLTKSDLCADLKTKIDEVKSTAIGVDIIVTSSFSDEGAKDLLPYIRKAETVAFIGSSGVGKSTLINRLSGNDSLKTGGLRNDDKGRHTTTRRELFMLQNGAMVIDTPGMRELGIENADFSKAFADIDDLAKNCRFRDCTHENEPGCAVRQAIAMGYLDEERLLSYRKLKKEAKYNGLNSRQIEDEKLKSMFGSKKEMKNLKKYLKNKKR